MCIDHTYEKLQQKIEDLERIFNLSPDMIGEGNLDGYFSKINSSFSQILGYTKEEFLKKPFIFFVHKDDLDNTKKALEDAARGKKTLFIENRYQCRDGSYKWIEWKVFSNVKENRFIAVGREITKRKLYQEDLNIFKKAVESSSDSIGMSTAEGYHYYQNQSFDDLFGDIGTDPPSTLYVDEHVGRDVFETIMGGGHWNGEVEMLGKDKTKLNVLLRAYPVKDDDDKVIKLVGIHTNITDRLELENTLRNQRDKAQNYLDIAGVMIVVINSDQKVSLINKKGCEILGYKEDDIIGQNWFERFLPERLKKNVKKTFDMLMKGKIEPVEYFENSVLTKTGEERIIAWHNTIFKNNEGNITSTLSSGLDITQRILAEKSLLKAHNKLRRNEMLLNDTQQLTEVGGWEWDVEKQTMFWTKEVYRIHDFNQDQFSHDTQKHIEKGLECYDPIDRAVILDSFKTCINKGISYDLEFPFTTSKGRRIWIRTVAKPVLKDNRVVTVVGNIMNITKRKQAEKSLQKAHDELEKKVNKRTKELTNANELLKSEIEDRKKAEEGLLKSREQLRYLSQYLQSSEEQERTHIAREVHDDLGQVLTAIKMDISWMKKKIHKNQKYLIQKAASTQGLVDQAIITVKKIITELRPGLLDDLGLVAAIEWYVKDFKNRTGIQIELKIDPSEINLHVDISTTIFRILQESLTNVARHSQATEIKVVLTKRIGSIELVVKDNGIGITKKQIGGRHSFGILGIKERVYILGGEVEIFSMVEKGTKVGVVIPID